MGLVNLFFWKDYELQSWNEQGEITQIKGMLTIAFLVVSPCFHRDKKELYLIIKILYMVNMPTEEKTIPKKVELQPVNLLKAFHEQRDLVEKLKLKLDVFEKANSIYEERIGELEKKLRQILEENKKQKEEIEILKKGNLRLKIISGEAKSGWIKERDWIYKPDSKTGKPKGYRCPFDFNHEDVEKLVIYFNEEKGEKWVDFEHPYPGYSHYPFDMPHTAYLWLKGELPEQKKKELESKKMDIHSINSVQEMNKFIQSIDKDAKLHRKFFHQTANYLLRNRNSRIKFVDYKKYAKFSGRQIGYDWLNDFQRWGFVKKVPNKKGYWDVIF